MSTNVKNGLETRNKACQILKQGILNSEKHRFRTWNEAFQNSEWRFFQEKTPHFTAFTAYRCIINTLLLLFKLLYPWLSSDSILRIKSSFLRYFSQKIKSSKKRELWATGIVWFSEIRPFRALKTRKLLTDWNLSGNRKLPYNQLFKFRICF